MQAEDPKYPDVPILILAPIGSDARNASDVLAKVNVRTQICSSIQEMCAATGEYAGALLISEEILTKPVLPSLLQYLLAQPVWSDIPLILLTGTGDIRQKTYNIVNYLGARANITLLEKPLRAFTLISVVKASLRSRAHQFEVRDLLQNYSKAVQDEQQATAKFRAIFDQSSVFAGVMSLDGTLIEANRLSLYTCGYTADQAVGKLFWESPWWRDNPEVQNKIRRGTLQAAKGTAYLEILTYLWADGSSHIVDFSLFPIRDESGKVIFLHPTGVDITERQIALERAEFLVQLTHKLSTVSDPAEINRLATEEIGRFLGVDRCFFFQPIEKEGKVRVLPDWRRNDLHSVEGIYDTTVMGKPEWWRAVKRGPVTFDDVRRDPWTKDFVSAYMALNVMSYALIPFIHEGEWVVCIGVGCAQARHWTPDETTLLENALARVWPLIERARVESALRDVNALLADKAAHLETLVQERTAKLRETIGDLEAFSYSIAHDMRAPLRSLQGFSEILLTDHVSKLDDEARHLLHRIANSAGRMDKLIKDVLNYSRVMRADFPMQTVNVGELLRGIVDSYPTLSPDKADITLEGPFPAVIGNEAMLTQILANLMGNAVKFMPAGVKPRLRVWAEPCGGNVRLHVEDNGIGIAADQHEKIFGIFQQVSKDFEGTGIGLAITKKAAERMGGTVGVKSELGQGSTFWVEIQQAPPVEVGG